MAFGNATRMVGVEISNFRLFREGYLVIRGTNAVHVMWGKNMIQNKFVGRINVYSSTKDRIEKS